MNGWKIDAQLCLIVLKPSTAIDMHMLQQLQKQLENGWILASIWFNYAYEWWFNQEQGNGFEEIYRKKWESKMVKIASRSRSEPKWNVNQVSVMIRLYICAVNDSC